MRDTDRGFSGVSISSEKIRDVNEEIQKIPSIFSNRFYITARPDVIRISFGEVTLSPHTSYHSAVVMPIDDAEALGTLLLKFVQEVKETKKN
ncbi:MAG TPA: hypothetical protein PK803_01350 [Alphaproteobacteria bacterium]|nr:hypothetical protein [Alphaproteobacteria bacterium]